MNNTSKKSDIHERVTASIVCAIEKGASNFEMPWHRKASSGLPRNVLSRKCYRGINTVALWSAGSTHGFGSNLWGTYKQWQTVGTYVKEGEHGSMIVFYKKIENDAYDATKSDNENEGQRVLLRYSVVFNADQVEGWGNIVDTDKFDSDRLALVDTFVNVLGADIRYGGNRAYYSPSHDRICMPSKSQFVDTSAGNATEGYYSVLLHEHIHWSGNKKRLDRDLAGRFGSECYAMEELIAELGAAFLCATLGISTEPRPDHASYVANWLKVLRNEKSAIFVAASQASKACTYLEDLYRYTNECQLR